MTDAEPYQIAAEVVADPGFAPELLHRLAHQALVEKVMRLDQQMASHMVDEARLIEADQAFIEGCGRAPGHRGGAYADMLEAAGTARERIELTAFVRAYRDRKHQRGGVEFADQQASATRLVLSTPQVSEALREQFAVVLLDEYQDTSAAQAAMLAGLFSGPGPSRGRGHPVSAVGDPLQAIYGWRGAAADNMGQFAGLFPCADGAAPSVFPLTINRRSGGAIVSLANAVASAMAARPCELLLAADPRKAAGLIEARLYQTRPEEVSALAGRVVEAHRLGQADSWADIGVLVRRNADIAALYEALTGLDVPVEIVGLGGLLALPEIAMVIGLLRVAADETHNPSIGLLVSGPACGLGVRDMAALARRAWELGGPEVRLLDAVVDPGDGVSPVGRERLHHLAMRIRLIQRQRHEPAADLVQIAADVLGLTAHLAVPSPRATAMASQLRRLIGYVSDHAASTGDLTLDGLLAWLEAESIYGESLDQAAPSADDSVKLLTVHKAKGLEWSVVALPGLNTGVFPSDRTGGNPLRCNDALPFDVRLDAASVPQLGAVTHKGFAEFSDALKADQLASEDRLCYVAVSRAKQVLLASASYWWPGRKGSASPSRLFQAIAEVADVVDLADCASGQNPLTGEVTAVDWPYALDDDAQARLDSAAAAVLARSTDQQVERGLSAEDAWRVQMWRAATDRLALSIAGERVAVPQSVSASALVTAHRDEAAFFDAIARPMPHLSSAGATRGVLFHRFVEQRFRQVGCALDDHDPSDSGWLGADDTAGIADLVRAFADGPYGERVPIAVEAGFVAVIAGQQVRGRIDAVYEEQGTHRFQIVDWKTSADMYADDAQLAIYRLAWAQITGCAVEQVDAVFYYVATGRIVRPKPVAQSTIEAWVTGLREKEPS